MSYVLGLIIAVAGLGILYAKIRNSIFSAKDGFLIKEDQDLKAKEDSLKQEVTNLTNNIKPPEALTPDQVEAYWSKK
jgi:hypothetical protein